MTRQTGKRETVAIIGGGIAGLSAAHELVERGFDVEIYERRPFFGGKAASYRVGAKDGPPGEHGFRFFPGWYRHLPDTLARIPYHEKGGGRRTVADNLVSVRSNLLAWFDRPNLSLPLQIPGNLTEVAQTSQFLAEFSRLGLSAAESALFMRKLIELLLMTDERRAEVLENKSWWDYVECSSPDRSRAYQDFVRASTRTSVAAKAEVVSAYTIGRLVVRSLLDTLGAVDRVLNGPTSEVWIEPWVSYLESRGVVFRSDMELSAIVLDSASATVRHVIMEPVLASSTRRLQHRLEELKRGATDPLLLDEVQDALKQMGRLLETQPLPGDELDDGGSLEKHERVERRATEGRRVHTDLQKLVARAIEVLRDSDEAVTKTALGRLEDALEQYASLQVQAGALKKTVVADYFVLALPLEQLAYYVNRSTMLTYLAPELRRVLPLSREMDWMAGIQFFLRSQLDMAPGHLVGMDSEWALTAIEQTQFWDDVDLPRGVNAILSVDIAAWDRKGRTIRKEAFNCDNQEIAEEVWAQLEEMLNKRNRSRVLRKDMLVGGDLHPSGDKQHPLSYHVDESIIDLRDRKKQAAYERSRGLLFGSLVEEEGESIGDKRSENYVWGPPRRRFNAEPLLINRVGVRKLRPDAKTSIPNLFLAGDYIKTETDLACMEGANEAARLAVNGILDAAASREPRCEVWPFSPSRQAVEAIVSTGTSLRAVRTVAAAVASLRDRIWRGFASGE